MTRRDDLDRLVEAITVDCYDDEEQMTAFHAVFSDEVEFPAPAAVLGIAVEVLGFDVREDGRELVARCRRPGSVSQEVSLVDLVFPPESVGGWLQAAYRRCLGLKPFEATIPPGWKPSWL